jgi:hypothetical protein
LIKKQRTPQEKKELSYARDRRNCYGESRHAARISIPLRKTKCNRANRRYQNQQLSLPPQAIDQDLADAVELHVYHRAPTEWKKLPDAPLKEIITWKLKAREEMQAAGGRRALRRSAK